MLENSVAAASDGVPDSCAIVLALPQLIAAYDWEEPQTRNVVTARSPAESKSAQRCRTCRGRDDERWSQRVVAAPREDRDRVRLARGQAVEHNLLRDLPVARLRNVNVARLYSRRVVCHCRRRLQHTAQMVTRRELHAANLEIDDQ